MTGMTATTATRGPAEDRLIEPKPEPADALLHPLALGAVAVLLLNDHLLKAAWPGIVTGKLSDLAGLAFFPLVLVGGVELALALRGRWRGPSRRLLLVATVATVIAFAGVKTLAPIADAWGWLLGAGQWAPTALLDVIRAMPAPAIRAAAVVRDPTDLLALPAVLVAWQIGRGRCARARSDGRPTADVRR